MGIRDQSLPITIGVINPDSLAEENQCSVIHGVLSNGDIDAIKHAATILRNEGFDVVSISPKDSELGWYESKGDLSSGNAHSDNGEILEVENGESELIMGVNFTVYGGYFVITGYHRFIDDLVMRSAEISIKDLSDERNDGSDFYGVDE